MAATEAARDPSLLTSISEDVKQPNRAAAAGGFGNGATATQTGRSLPECFGCWAHGLTYLLCLHGSVEQMIGWLVQGAPPLIADLPPIRHDWQVNRTSQAQEQHDCTMSRASSNALVPAFGLVPPQP